MDPKRGILLLTFGVTKLLPFATRACSCAGARRMILVSGSLFFLHVFASFLRHSGIQILASSNNVILCLGSLQTESLRMACCGRLAQMCRIPPLPERAYTWTWFGTACLMGKFCQLTFPTMANVGLSPMMCYSHPGRDFEES